MGIVPRHGYADSGALPANDRHCVRCAHATILAPRSANLSFRQNHDNDCARMSSCRNSKHFHLNIPAPFRRTRASLSTGAHAHTADFVHCSITYAVKIASVFFVADLTPDECTAEILLSLSGYSFTVTWDVFCFVFFYLADSFEDTSVSVRISIAGSLNCRKGFRFG